MNLIEIVVAALHQHIRQQLGNQAARRDVVKHDDVINKPQSSEYLSTLRLVEDGPVGSLQLSHGAITIYPDDESIAEGARLSQIAHMPDVQKVKHTIRKNEPLAASAQTPALGKHRRRGQNLFDH